MCEGENFEMLNKMINESGEYFLQKSDYTMNLGFFPLEKKPYLLAKKSQKRVKSFLGSKQRTERR